MEADLQDLLSFQSCRSSVVDHVKNVSLDSPSNIQDVQVVMSETAGKATRGEEKDAWKLEPEGETETLETKVVPNGVEGVQVDPEGEGRHERRHQKFQKAKRSARRRR